MVFFSVEKDVLRHFHSECGNIYDCILDYTCSYGIFIAIADITQCILSTRALILDYECIS